MKKNTILIIFAALALVGGLVAGAMFYINKNMLDNSAGSVSAESLYIRTKEKDCLTLYICNDSPLRDVLAGKIDEYNESAGNGLDIEMTVYENEEIMAAYMDSKRPDMFICGYGAAHTLSREHKLKEIDSAVEAPVYKEELAGIDRDIGKKIFPLGMETEVLVVKNGTFDAFPKTFMEMFKNCREMSMDSGKPVIYIDSFTSLFRRAVKERGGVFRYNTEDNSTEFNDVYNSIFSAAYTGGIAFGNFDALEVMGKDNISCAAMPSTAIKGRTAAGCDIAEIPQAGAEKAVTGTMHCLVISDSGDSKACSKFISWLGSPDRLEETALSSALVPVITVRKEAESVNEENGSDNVTVKKRGTTADRLSAVLRNIADTSSFAPENEREYGKVEKEVFETQFRKSLKSIA